MDSESYEKTEEENEDYEGYEEENEYSGLGASVSERPAFSDDSLKYAKSMSVSSYKIDVLNYIKKLPITGLYKRELYHCIHSLFTEERVLAYNDPRKIGRFSTDDQLSRKIIFAQRNMELARCVATKTDLERVGSMEKYVLSVFEDYYSRTIGPKKERWINSELSTRSISQSEIVKNNQVSMEPRKKKGGFLGFGGSR